MTKLLATICIFVTLFALCSADCSATAELRSVYGLTNSLTSPQTYSGIQYCKSIKDGPVCCTDTQINSFQDMADTYLANLTDLVATRDTYIVNVQQNVIPLMQASLETIQTQAEQLSSLTNSSALGNSSDLEDGLAMLANASSLLTLINSNVADDYTNYQKSRQTCVVSMVKLQLAALCLSCDPNAASKGFSNTTGDLSISDRVCTRIQNGCSDYIAASENQNAIITASYGAQILQTIAAILEAVASSDYDSLANLEDSLDEIQGPDSYLVAPAVTPVGCEVGNNGTCIWICSNLFNGVGINLEDLIVGGQPDDISSDDTDPNDGGRILAKADSNYRTLGSGDFDPDSDESGVTVTFAQDPSGTNTQDTSFGNLSFGNVFVSMMIVLASLLAL